jgi:hypothetical protein
LVHESDSVFSELVGHYEKQIWFFAGTVGVSKFRYCEGDPAQASGFQKLASIHVFFLQIRIFR